MRYHTFARQFESVVRLRRKSMGKREIDPLPDRHQKLHTWLYPGYLPTYKI